MDFIIVDLSIIPPKIYLGNIGEPNAIRKEIWCLFPSNYSTGGFTDTHLRIVALRDPSSASLPRYSDNLVARYKNANAVMAMFCQTGDTISIARSSFTFAPTPDRAFIRALAAFSTNWNLSLVSRDVAQDFLQSDCLSVADQYDDSPPPTHHPPCLIVRNVVWDGCISDAPSKTLPAVTYGPH